MLPPLIGSPMRLDGKSAPHGCTIRSLLLFLVLSSLRRSPIAVFFGACLVAAVFAVRLYGVLCWRVTHEYACGGSVCRPSCPPSLPLSPPSLFLFLFSLSLSLSRSSLPQPVLSLNPPMSCCLMSREDIIVIFKPSQSREPWAICCRFCLAFLVCGIGSL